MVIWMMLIYCQQIVKFFDIVVYYGYWFVDFWQVDLYFGLMVIFDMFMKVVKGVGMKVVFDQVINYYGYEVLVVKVNLGWFNGKVQCDVIKNKDVDCFFVGLFDLCQSVFVVCQQLFGNGDFWWV